VDSTTTKKDPQMLIKVPTTNLEAPAPPSRPEPISITVTASDHLSIYGLTSKQMAICHRSAAPCDLGGDNALVAATTRGLCSLSTRTTEAELLICQRWAAAEGHEEPTLLTIEIRTDNPSLIEAATYLREEPATIADESRPLKKQLRRFNVRWTLLQPDSEELKALQRWAELECRPGVCIGRAEETRYRAAKSTYEPQHGGIDAEAERDTGQDASQDEGQDEAAEAA
jgi:hypothetical protein